MDEAAYFELETEVWHWVDRGELVARLAAGGEGPAPAEIDDKLARFFAELCARLRRRRSAEGRAWLHIYEDFVEMLEDAEYEVRADTSIHDALRPSGLGLEIVPLLGERYFTAVMGEPACLERLAGTTRLDGTDVREGIWRAVCDRWREELLVDIPIAFDAVPYPGHDAVESGDWGTTEECRWFRGQDWREIDPRALHVRHADLGFFDDTGFRYLLPAFMRASILDRDGTETCGLPIRDSILYQLAHHRDPGLFDPDQRAVVVSYLELEFGRCPDRDLAIALKRLSG